MGHPSRYVVRRGAVCDDNVCEETIDVKSYMVKKNNGPSERSDSLVARLCQKIASRRNSDDSDTDTESDTDSEDQQLPQRGGIVRLLRRNGTQQRSPARRSPSPSSSPRRSPSPVRRSPSPSSSPRRSPVRRSPSPAKRSPSPVRRAPSSSPRRSPVRKAPSPAKRSPIRRAPAKRTPIRRAPSPAKRSPSPVRRSPVRRAPPQRKATCCPCSTSTTPSAGQGIMSNIAALKLNLEALQQEVKSKTPTPRRR